MGLSETFPLFVYDSLIFFVIRINLISYVQIKYSLEPNCYSEFQEFETLWASLSASDFAIQTATRQDDGTRQPNKTGFPFRADVPLSLLLGFIQKELTLYEIWFTPITETGKYNYNPSNL